MWHSISLSLLQQLMEETRKIFFRCSLNQSVLQSLRLLPLRKKCIDCLKKDQKEDMMNDKPSFFIWEQKNNKKYISLLYKLPFNHVKLLNYQNSMFFLVCSLTYQTHFSSIRWVTFSQQQIWYQITYEICAKRFFLKGHSISCMFTILLSHFILADCKRGQLTGSSKAPICTTLLGSTDHGSKLILKLATASRGYASLLGMMLGCTPDFSSFL